jgi:alpha-D-ribose 1-methylphosphonate 5-triphosphate synthase subunit PhnG
MGRPATALFRARRATHVHKPWSCRKKNAVRSPISWPALGDAVITAILAETGGTGKPFNIASDALLTHMVAQVTELSVGDFVHSFDDTHLDVNHLDQAKLQRGRDFRPLPKLTQNPAVSRLEDFNFADVTIEGHDPHPAIKASSAI